MIRLVIVGLVVGSLVCLPVARAQYTGNSQTNIISGVISNWSGNYYVGNSFSTNVLIVQNNGVLTDATGYLGYFFFSSNNSAVVTDSGSIWSNGWLYVGDGGVGNSLVVSNGGLVLVGGYAYVGGGGVSRMSSNSVVVTGNGSVWSNGQDLGVGYPAAGNHVLVSNGGLLVGNRGYIGSYYSTSSNNSVVVTDAGSVWTNNSDLFVGDWGVSNSLIVSNAGKVFSGNGYVGYQIGSGSNGAQVTGAGSLWTNRNDLFIGYSGTRNSLTILNSGVVCSTVGHIGYNSTAISNSVTISGTGTVWNANGDVFVGQNGSNGILIVDTGGQLIQTSFGRLFLGGDINNNNPNVGRNHIVVSGGLIRNSSSLSSPAMYFGYSSSGNSLVISNGGQVMCGYGYVGERFNSSNNSVLVTGPGSVWSNRNDLYVGDSGSSNTLVISDGGLVNDSSSYVGYSLSSNNTVLVTGAGSVWSNRSALYFDFSRNNSLVISNGGHMINLGVAYFLRDQIVVTGTGSVWNSGSVSFGGGGGLTINDSGQVINGDAYAGLGFNNSNFTVRVADGGVWQNGALYVGSQGRGNSVTVAGGTVLATLLLIGLDSPTCDNWVQLDSGNLFVTNATGDATLEVRFGKFILNGGVLRVDRLVMTNACGLFIRHGGTLIAGSLVLDPNLDADGDGIANGWEQAYGLDPLNAADASADNDGDGFTNLQEFQAGTDPTNASSAFRIVSIVPTNVCWQQPCGDLFITWRSGGGRTNVVQSAPDLTGSYSNVSPNIILTGSGDVTTNYLDAGGATNASSQFYRIRLVP